MMITLPIFMPVVASLKYNTVWFLVLFLNNIEKAGIRPPPGLSLFVMKGVVGDAMTMGDIYRASVPFLGLGTFGHGLGLGVPIAGALAAKIYVLA